MSESTETMSCHACSTDVHQVHEKNIAGYIYQYCSKTCADSDFTTCSSCIDSAEISVRDCAREQYGCCQQYLGGHLYHYCSELCRDEDTTAFIRSFRKPLKNN